jgi:hypothetical protein
MPGAGKELADMTRPRRLVPDDHYRVRVVFPGAIVHLGSQTQPQLVYDDAGRVRRCVFTPVGNDTDVDVAGYIDWLAVIGITWRRVDAAAIRVA